MKLIYATDRQNQRFFSTTSPSLLTLDERNVINLLLMVNWNKRSPKTTKIGKEKLAMKSKEIHPIQLASFLKNRVQPKAPHQAYDLNPHCVVTQKDKRRYS